MKRSACPCPREALALPFRLLNEEAVDQAELPQPSSGIPRSRAGILRKPIVVQGKFEQEKGSPAVELQRVDGFHAGEFIRNHPTFGHQDRLAMAKRPPSPQRAFEHPTVAADIGQHRIRRRRRQEIRDIGKRVVRVEPQTETGAEVGEVVPCLTSGIVLRRQALFQGGGQTAGRGASARNSSSA
ncbi:hypothetical protein D3869_32045 (plasmid) [Azospirillum brasilense]|uniref:Uncharacterized protein n=1 Tax=Azospirillum brasilense TaxID=192 RepID=A0A4D8RF59_AZOBR|nr:hypothetical protein [Azospirillum brasilense]QCO19880.1 hypothetical protein D3869_32045 [Azospirillum brasilense]